MVVQTSRHMGVCPEPGLSPKSGSTKAIAKLAQGVEDVDSMH